MSLGHSLQEKIKTQGNMFRFGVRPYGDFRKTMHQNLSQQAEPTRAPKGSAWLAGGVFIDP